uniref:TetR/AcrR family transcriptional regulator n=1 Tax=Tetragenococcus halophilus TaxID=51669 RepID=UPI0024E1381A|nr:TetR/AcrR family transcriptional regulator [Tetragenococcus halophilus]
MDPKKQERVINAALKEFAAKGYKHASTNEIVKEANISKGLLFHYFKGKEELYLYISNYSFQIIEKIFEITDLNEKDLFKRIEAIGIAKFQIEKRFPRVFDFLLSTAKEDTTEINEKNKNRINLIYRESLEVLYENIDYSKFKDEVDIKKAIDILTWTLLGYGNRAIEELDSLEKVIESYLKEWKQYSEILQKAFYK